MAEIRNPNQQGGQDSKTVLIFTGLFLVMFLGLQFYKQQHKAPAASHPVQPAAATSSPQSVSPESHGAAMPAGPGPSVQAATESTTVVENELYRITFSNRGGQATSWILKKYKDEDGKPLDLVNRTAAAKFGYPLSTYTSDAGLRGLLVNALYKPSATGEMNAPGTLVFDYSANGVTVKKTFTFGTDYIVRAQVTATRNGAPLEAMLAWPSGFGDQQTLPQYAGGMVDSAQGDKVEEVAYKKVPNGGTQQGQFAWAGVSDLYFAAIFLPQPGTQSQFISLHNTITIPKNRKHPEPNQTESAGVLGAAIGSTSGTFSTRIFAGPKALAVLGSIPTDGGPSLEKVVSFGMWGVVAKPLFLVLRFFHQHLVSNWGWAILLLTVILNVAMLPTRFQMMKSSLKMQRIQPQMDQIKQKYAKFKATDPRKQDMQREIMALQKREGVNMFGGCLPMLIQYPLLLGFYRMLDHVIELRQAHWLWLPDLSAPDPYHILPIFFIISMFAVQWLTPSPGVDASQQKMMAFTMPAVFGFMTWNIGSGLALYWAGSNVLGIVQQMAMNKTKLGREAREIAARRAAKKAGKVINARR